MKRMNSAQTATLLRYTNSYPHHSYIYVNGCALNFEALILYTGKAYVDIRVCQKSMGELKFVCMCACVSAAFDSSVKTLSDPSNRPWKHKTC